jgi:hypothetical protein
MNGLKLVLSITAFNRILDFSNGLDFYPGFFYNRPEGGCGMRRCEAPMYPSETKGTNEEECGEAAPTKF